MKKRILCYGDSNTWGYIPGSGLRYGDEIRWTGVCAARLGEEYRVLEEGLNGRTTVFENSVKPFMNGKAGLGYTLLAQKPIDLTVLMLGTNDLMYVDAYQTSRGADELVRYLLNADMIINSSQPIFPNGSKILLVSPPLIGKNIEQVEPENPRTSLPGESQRLANLYRHIAESRDVFFLDAAQYASVSPIDCVHLDAQSHIRLGEAIAEKISEIFR